MNKAILIAMPVCLAALTSSAAEAPAPARRLYAAKCASCHKLYDPARYDDANWEKWMDKMKRKARLNDSEYGRLREYLDSLRN